MLFFERGHSVQTRARPDPAWVPAIEGMGLGSPKDTHPHPTYEGGALKANGEASRAKPNWESGVDSELDKVLSD